MDALRKLFSSKRFIAAVTAIAVLVLVDFLNVEEDLAVQITSKVMTLTLALIGSYTATDMVLAVKGKKKE